MPNGQKDTMAQAVYLAQLEAAKGNCKCRTCQILRKATASMTEAFLQEPANPALTPTGGIEIPPPPSEEG
jgi:hypothetical protein